MTARTLQFSLPDPGSTSSRALAATLTTVGGVAGMAISTAASVDTATAVLVGLAAGAFGGRVLDGDAAGRALPEGVLALGCAAFAARMFALDAAWLAWPLAVAALAVATGAPGARTATGRRMAWIMTVAGVAAGFALAMAAFTVGGLYWQAGDLAATAVFGGLVATGAWLGNQQARVVATDAEESTAAAALPAGGDTQDATCEGTAFDASLAELQGVARRIDARIRTLRDGSEVDEVIASQVADALARAVEDAEGSVARWRHVDVDEESRRADRIRARITRLEAERDAEPDAAVRQAADAAIDRQRHHLDALEAAAASRRRFGFRLERMHASLELLELGLDRALTAEGALEPDAVDGMIELLTDTCDALDDDLVSASVEPAVVARTLEVASAG